MRITIGTTVVADGVRHLAHSFRVGHSRSLQVSGFLRAARAAVFDRGNITTRVSFGVDRAFDSAPGALGWLMRHFDLISGTQDVLFELDNEDGTSTVIGCSGAGVSASEGQWEGLCIPVSYDLQVPSIEISSGPALEWEGAEMRVRTDITGLTGGGPSNLDGIATTSFTPGEKFLWLWIGDRLRCWAFVPDGGDAAEAVVDYAGTVIPDDHDPATNPNKWISVK